MRARRRGVVESRHINERLCKVLPDTIGRNLGGRHAAVRAQVHKRLTNMGLSTVNPDAVIEAGLTELRSGKIPTPKNVRRWYEKVLDTEGT